MDNEEFSPVIDKRKKNKTKTDLVANDPQVEVNDTASEHAQEQPKKKVKAKHGLKPFAFFSGIFDLVLFAAVIGMGLYIYVSISSLVQFAKFNVSFIDFVSHNNLEGFLFGVIMWPFLILMIAIMAVTAILFLIGGISTIVSSFKSDRKNNNGLIIATAVFDMLLLVFVIIFASITSGEASNLVCIVLSCLLVLGFIFKIVDVVLTKKRLKKYQTAKMEEYSETYHGPNFDNLNGINNVQKKEKLEEPPVENTEQQNTGVDFSKLKK